VPKLCHAPEVVVDLKGSIANYAAERRSLAAARCRVMRGASA
jgi:hypothetical protein